jgi:hypothetical protein
MTDRPLAHKEGSHLGSRQAQIDYRLEKLEKRVEQLERKLEEVEGIARRAGKS